jgi:hypothetical protein
MARSKRRPRAKNKITGAFEGALSRSDSPPLVNDELSGDGPPPIYRTDAVVVTRSTLFTAEFEALIELIARDRVYRAMLDRLGRRLISGPHPYNPEPRRLAE